jgi:hypothetical protein
MDEPPRHGQEVIICVNGVYYLAVYHAESDCYRLSDPSEIIFDPKQYLIYWMLNYRTGG